MEPAPTLVLANVTLPGGRVADITLAGGKVSHVGAKAEGVACLECRGLLVLPGAVDMHVHMRGGVQSAKEDWASGSRSAIAGGVTVVVDQPNTVPPIGTPASLHERVRDAAANSLCSFGINSSVERTTPLRAMWEAGALAFGETFFAPSTGGEAISPEDLGWALGQIHALGGLATIHAETVGDGDDTSLPAHDRIRSADGEREAVIGAGKANTAGCRLHFCHLSTKRSIDAATGTVEVTPHHLFLSLEDFTEEDGYARVNPPLRTERERRQVWERWGRIDVIASDHAPHTRAEKEGPFSQAPAGICGTETMVPLLLARALDGKCSLFSVITKTSTRPAEILGIPRAGFSVGDRADFALYPPVMAPVIPEALHSRCGWSPFGGQMAVFPRTVVRAGQVVFSEGEFFSSEPTWFSGKGYISRTAK